MKRYIFSIIAIIITLSGAKASVADSIAPKVRYNIFGHPITKRTNASLWQHLTPGFAKLQFAGNMGAASVGIGWSYGKNHHWSTSLSIGLIPKHNSKCARATMTLKQDFIPWSIRIGNSRFSFHPLSCGLYLNTVFGSEFWASQPDKYPDGYYWFATRIRSNIYIGECFTYLFKETRFGDISSISLFYEISANDFHIIQRVKNKYLDPGDYLCFSIGLRVNWM